MTPSAAVSAVGMDQCAAVPIVAAAIVAAAIVAAAIVTAAVIVAAAPSVARVDGSVLHYSGRRAASLPSGTEGTQIRQDPSAMEAAGAALDAREQMTTKSVGGAGAIKRMAVTSRAARRTTTRAGPRHPTVLVLQATALQATALQAAAAARSAAAASVVVWDGAAAAAAVAAAAVAAAAVEAAVAAITCSQS